MSWRRGAAYGLLTLAGLQFTSDNIGCIVSLTGASMEPTFQDRDYLVAEKLGGAPYNLSLGDIVIATDPRRDSGDSICKRIAGLSGDTVSASGYGPIEVPPNHVWLEGDNSVKGNSDDSRLFGPVPRALVEGRVTYRIWPPNKLKCYSQHWFFTSPSKS